jgi:hypothetical protein
MLWVNIVILSKNLIHLPSMTQVPLILQEIATTGSFPATANDAVEAVLLL